MPVLRVKVERVRRQRRFVGAQIDVPVNRISALFAFICKRDARMLLKRASGKKQFSALSSDHRKRRGLIKKIVSQSEPEEVANRRLPRLAENSPAVPVHAQHHFLQVKPLVARNRGSTHAKSRPALVRPAL